MDDEIATILKGPVEEFQTMDVHISANAFWALLISAIEVYKKECYGILLGYRDSSNIYIVEHAISYQTAQSPPRQCRKKQSRVAAHPQVSGEPSASLHDRRLSFAHGWGDLKSVGNLSTEDLSDMIAGHLNFIIVANDNRRSSAWKYNGDGTLSGTVDDYHFRIGAYH